MTGPTYSAPRRSLLFATLTPPDWKEWQNIPNAKLFEAVALSCNLDPRCVIGWATPGPIYDKNLVRYQSLVRQAVASLDIYEGDLRSLNSDPTPHEVRVALGDFRAWALSREWELPDAFPCFTAKRPQKETPEERRGRLGRLVDAELRRGKTMGEALAFVAESEPSQSATFPTKRITPETLRKIYRKYRDSRAQDTSNTPTTPP